MKKVILIEEVNKEEQFVKRIEEFINEHKIKNLKYVVTEIQRGMLYSALIVYK